MRILVLLGLLMVSRSLLSNDVLMEEHRGDFYKYACDNRQYFRVEDFYRNKVFSKIIVGLPQFCEAYNLTDKSLEDLFNDDGSLKTAPDFTQLDFRSMSRPEGYMTAILIGSKDRKVTEKMYQHPPDSRNIFSLLITLAVTRVWDGLTEKERLDLMTDGHCDFKSDFALLPKFSDPKVQPGSGDLRGSTAIKRICRAENLGDALAMIPESIVAEALLMSSISGKNINSMAAFLCYHKSQSPALVDTSFEEALKSDPSTFEAFDTYLNIYSNYGMHGKAMISKQFYGNSDTELSEEETSALKEWAGNKYFWLSNREEYGKFGDIFSMFHRNADKYERPENLPQTIEDLKKAIDTLPPHKGITFRGERRSNAKSYYQVGRRFTLNTFTSTSTKFYVASHFASASEVNEDYDPRVAETYKKRGTIDEDDYDKLHREYRTKEYDEDSVLLVIRGESGRNIMRQAKYSAEREVLFDSGVSFKVISVEDLRDGKGIKVFVEEVTQP